ncbi:conserved hypothetical protein [Microbacterium sp. 8M]|uniref:hypothetical protein n=1 Tax=Microbacterium sp. 8M TaxID=2653153 RepID=UPI0012F1D0A7|nr:hypothetical protein [Microbacterium sp. 8M]VXC30173.1 conserved hypothetical protein [Microbacterium sp. 8M]
MNRIWFPNQRWIRTAVQVVLAGIALLGIFVTVAPQVLAAVADVLPGPAVAWLTALIATLAAISAAISRVMAIPIVDQWLRKFGAGSAPAGAIIHTDFDGTPVPMTRRQYRAMLDGAKIGEKGAAC